MPQVGRDIVLLTGWGTTKEPYIVGALFAFHDATNLAALVAYDARRLRAAFATLYVTSATGGGRRAHHRQPRRAHGGRARLHAPRDRAELRRARNIGSLRQDAPRPARSDVRLVGTIIRREADGTLGELLSMLRRTLADYDAPTAKRLDARLRR